MRSRSEADLAYPAPEMQLHSVAGVACRKTVAHYLVGHIAVADMVPADTEQDIAVAYKVPADTEQDIAVADKVLADIEADIVVADMVLAGIGADIARADM